MLLSSLPVSCEEASVKFELLVERPSIEHVEKLLDARRIRKAKVITFVHTTRSSQGCIKVFNVVGGHNKDATLVCPNAINTIQKS
jgi:hypothetical protein